MFSFVRFLLNLCVLFSCAIWHESLYWIFFYLSYYLTFCCCLPLNFQYCWRKKSYWKLLFCGNEIGNCILLFFFDVCCQFWGFKFKENLILFDRSWFSRKPNDLAITAWRNFEFKSYFLGNWVFLDHWIQIKTWITHFVAFCTHLKRLNK